MTRGQRGQAAVELVGGLPLLLVVAAVAFQLLVTVYSLHLADGAAEAGALAIAAGAPAEPAVRAALPGWARGSVEVSVEAGRVRVAIRPPGPLGAVGPDVGSSAWARPAGG